MCFIVSNHKPSLNAPAADILNLNTETYDTIWDSDCEGSPDLVLCALELTRFIFFFEL